MKNQAPPSEPPIQPTYQPTSEQITRIKRNFRYHTPTSNQPARYEAIRAYARNFAELICEETPASREQSLALTKLEEAVMWANAAIARNEP